MINPNQMQLKQLILISIFSAFLLITLNSCEEEPGNFGNNFIEPLDSVNVVTDSSFHLKSYVYQLDPVITSKTKYVLIGKTEDPYFGKTNSAFLTQLNYPINGDFGNNPVLDSIALYFKANKYYDDNGFSDIEVYQLNKPLSRDIDYYSDLDPSEFYASPKISEGTDYQNDSVIIKLKRSYGELLLANDTNAIRPDEDSLFYEKIPGLYCTINEIRGKGYYAQVDLNNVYTKLRIWYHNDLTEEGESKTYDYLIHNDLVNFNVYNYDTTSLVQGEGNVRTFLSNDKETPDSLLFISGPAGYGSRFVLPQNLADKFSNDSLFLASAELKLHVSDEHNNFPVNEKLYFYNNAIIDTTDIAYGKSKYIKNGNYFIFDLTKLVQKYIDGTYDRNIYLQTVNNVYEPGMTTFKGSDHPTKPPEFKVKYYKP